MPAPGVTAWRMDVGVIVYCAELETPALRETARRILEAEAARFGVSLEPAEVLLRRGRGGSTMHVVAAGEEPVRHLAATEADPLAEDGPLMVLARAGALALASRAEVAGTVVHR
jgi:hypothetical protein